MSALLAEHAPITKNHDIKANILSKKDVTNNNKRFDDDDEQHDDEQHSDGNIPGGMCPSIVRYARPQKARSAKGEWKYIVNTGQHTQTLRLEKCRYIT